jgi:hypothetical protein
MMNLHGLHLSIPGLRSCLLISKPKILHCKNRTAEAVVSAPLPCIDPTGAALPPFDYLL